MAELLTDYNCVTFTINTPFDISSLIFILNCMVGGRLPLLLFTIIISLLYLTTLFTATLWDATIFELTASSSVFSVQRIHSTWLHSKYKFSHFFLSPAINQRINKRISHSKSAYPRYGQKKRPLHCKRQNCKTHR